MISKIVMKNVATFNANGATIENLAKLNFFFGNNGSGKSTIAKFLYDRSRKNTTNEQNKFADCELEGYNSTDEEILVFDNEFIKRSFLDSDTLPGIFSLDEKNKDIDDEIKKNEKTIETKQTQTESIVAEIENCEKRLKELHTGIVSKCFDKRDAFKSFAKIKLPNAGSKENHFKSIAERLNKNDIVRQDIQKLTSKYHKLYEEELKPIQNSIDIKNFNEVINIQSKLSDCLDEIIVGKDDVQLAKMINEFGLKSWVAQGKEFLSETNGKCPFCQQQTIDNVFIEQLNAIFDEASKQKIENINNLKTSYEHNYSRMLNNINDVAREYNEKNCVSGLHSELERILNENLKIIDEKFVAPNEKKAIQVLDESMKIRISQINDAIRQNNEFYNDKENQRKNLTEHIIDYLATECKPLIDEYKKNKQETETEKETKETEKIKVDTEIKKLKSKNDELRTQTKNTEDAIKNIKNILKSTGFDGFEIKEKNKENNISQYYLSRNNESYNSNVFNTLSEGEKNFIAFLYFHQLCLGTTDFDTSSSRKKILVIDDPVSSMDSQSLFVVSTILHSLIKQNSSDKNEFLNERISQVVILTHNLYFYKEISLNCRPICKKRMHYKISKNNNVSLIEQRGKGYQPLDDYALMWETLREIKSKLDNNEINDNDKTQNVLLGNLFRRILESFCNFIGIGNDVWKIVEQDDQTSTEYLLKCAFLSIINDESHKVSSFDDAYFVKIHEENLKKLFEVFKSIFDEIGEEHYDKMMKINN